MIVFDFSYIKKFVLYISPLFKKLTFKNIFVLGTPQIKNGSWLSKRNTRKRKSEEQVLSLLTGNEDMIRKVFTEEKKEEN
jgi:hypothetical protein